MSEKWFSVNGEWRQSLSPQEMADQLMSKYNLKTEKDVMDWIDQQLRQIELEEELEAMDAADNAVDLMDRYPDAEAMIERLKRDYL